MPIAISARKVLERSRLPLPHPISPNSEICETPSSSCSSFDSVGFHTSKRARFSRNVSQHYGLSAESIQRVVQPTVTQDGQRAPGLKFGDPTSAYYLSVARNAGSGQA